MLTCYDAAFATLCDQAGVEILLVGDSLGMVIQGHDSTLPVTMDEMEYHVRMVARGSERALVLADLPFASYQVSQEKAYSNAARLMAAGAQMVKLEGGKVMAETIRFLVERGIPVCAHVGLIPQSVHQLGGYRVQGKSDDGARQLLEDARAIGETFNITGPEVYTWDQIYTIIADALGVTPRLVHVASEMYPLVAPDWFWSGEMLGDIGHSAVFDTTKIRTFVPGYAPRLTFHRAATRMIAWRDAHPESTRGDAETDAYKTLNGATTEDSGRA